MPFNRLASLFLLLAGLAVAPAIAAEPENTMIITLEEGDVTIALRPDLAPQHVEQIKALVREGAYDNVAFHRVIPGFMAQTGDVQHGDMEDGYNEALVGTGGSQLPDLPAEFSDVPFERGVVGMARAQSPDSANSQFFIMTDPAPSLNGQYTVIGTVESGMELIDGIEKGDVSQGGKVADPDRMLEVRIAADEKGG